MYEVSSEINNLRRHTDIEDIFATWRVCPSLHLLFHQLPRVTKVFFQDSLVRLLQQNSICFKTFPEIVFTQLRPRKLTWQWEHNHEWRYTVSPIKKYYCPLNFAFLEGKSRHVYYSNEGTQTSTKWLMVWWPKKHQKKNIGIQPNQFYLLIGPINYFTPESNK